LEITATLGKLIQASSAAITFQRDPTAHLEAALAIYELYAQRLSELLASGRFASGSKSRNTPDILGVSVCGEAGNIEEAALRSVLAALRCFSQSESIQAEVDGNMITCKLIGDNVTLPTVEESLRHLSVWARAELTLDPADSQIRIMFRG
jgi:hypothetical protein